MSHKDGRVVLSAWVDPPLRDAARVAAQDAGLEFSRWVARAIQRAVAAESGERAAARAWNDAWWPGGVMHRRAGEPKPEGGGESG